MKLLNNGSLVKEGYSFEEYEYHKSDIKGLKARIKERDYYHFINKDYGLCITVDNNSYMDLVSVTFIDFSKNYFFKTKTYINLPKGKIVLPSSSKEGDIHVATKDFKIDIIIKEDGNKYIEGNIKNFTKGKDFSFKLNVKGNTNNKIYMLTPFAKKRHFYYNLKENLLFAEGTISYDEKIIEFKAPGGLDWGRGVWTYKNTWYWSSLNGIKDDKLFGFNLGYGFGTNKENENIVYFDNEKYKLPEVEFIFQVDKKGKNDYSKDVKIVSEDDSVNLTMTPIFNRKDYLNALIISSDQNQVFGKFNGTIKIKDKTIKFNDDVGFLEKVRNKW